MITQNIDYDILKMDYKDCIEIIDKSCNIEYINKSFLHHFLIFFLIIRSISFYNYYKILLNKLFKI